MCCPRSHVLLWVILVPSITSSFSGGRCTGDMNSFESLSGPDCGTSLGFANSSTWSKLDCWPGCKEKVLQWQQGGGGLLGAH